MQISSIRVGYLVHAYRQAPWRIQRQWLMGFLLGVVAIAMVSSLYLDITAQAAIAGREIQQMKRDIGAVRQGSSDLETRLAELSSDAVMEKRAKDLGYEPVDPEKLQYIAVPGYVAPQADILAVAPALQPSAPSIPPEYTESLIEWLQQQMRPAPGFGITGISQ